MITSLLLLGTMALYGGSEDDGNRNVYYGGIAGHSLNSESKNNLFMGYASGYYTEGNSSQSWTGDENVYLGAYSGYKNTTGYYNTFTGAWSGYYNTTGSNNTFTGIVSGTDNTTGYYNTFTGAWSGRKNTTGSYNTFNGRWSGYKNTTGSYNTFLGYSSGGNADINSSVLIGFNAGNNASRDNTLYIANNATDTPLIYGEFDTEVVKINGELNTTNTVTASVTEDSTANTKTLFTLMRNNTNTSYESDVSFVLENVQKSFQWTFRTLASEKGFSISKVNSGKKEMILTGYDHSDGIQILMGDGGKYSGGQWLVASSRAYKENIKEIDTHTALEAFHQLKPVHFNYKTDKKEGVIGFIAEDVPSIVATKKRDALSAMEMVALLTKVVQVQEENLKDKDNEITLLKNRLDKIESLLCEAPHHK